MNEFGKLLKQRCTQASFEHMSIGQLLDFAIEQQALHAGMQTPALSNISNIDLIRALENLHTPCNICSYLKQR